MINPIDYNVYNHSVLMHHNITFEKDGEKISIPYTELLLKGSDELPSRTVLNAFCNILENNGNKVSNLIASNISLDHMPSINKYDTKKTYNIEGIKYTIEAMCYLYTTNYGSNGLGKIDAYFEMHDIPAIIYG